jgi:hypothetical protein
VTLGLVADPLQEGTCAFWRSMFELASPFVPRASQVESWLAHAADEHATVP